MGKNDPLILLQKFQGTKTEQLQQLYDQWYGCERCGLCQWRIDNSGAPFKDIVFADGNPDCNSRVMLIGEAPGAEEESCGTPFVGASGRLLNQMLAHTAADVEIQEAYRQYNFGRRTEEKTRAFHDTMLAWRNQEFFTTNIVACRPPENRAPAKHEILACLERLYNIIHIVDPWLIITFGKVAIEALLKKSVQITKEPGKIWEVDVPGRLIHYKKEVVALLHPSFLLRTADWNTDNGNYVRTLRDLRAALVYSDHLKNYYLGTPIPARPAVRI